MQLINGIEIAEKILNKCKNTIEDNKIAPSLAIIMIGNNPASLTYIAKKQQAGEKAGLKVNIHKFENADEYQILDLIQKLNTDRSVNGIIVQLPTPNLDQYKLCKAIDPKKDVDGLNPFNLGDLWLSNHPNLIPATVKAVKYALEFVATSQKQTLDNYLQAKTVLIVNRSNIIGKPLAGLLLNYNATITLAHSQTKQLEQHIANSDIIISGTGKENFIQDQIFKENAVLIDVGFNKTNDRIFGDVNRNTTQDKISWLSPVPGGIGPIGVACLIENTVEATIAQMNV